MTETDIAAFSSASQCPMSTTGRKAASQSLLAQGTALTSSSQPTFGISADPLQAFWRGQGVAKQLFKLEEEWRGLETGFPGT